MKSSRHTSELAQRRMDQASALAFSSDWVRQARPFGSFVDHCSGFAA